MDFDGGHAGFFPLAGREDLLPCQARAPGWHNDLKPDHPKPLMLSVVSGLLAGMVHVLSGPDHLAAVGPLAVDSRTAAWRIGVRWGIGHAGGVTLVGLLAILLRQSLPLEDLSKIGERLVGVLLVGLGIWSFRKAMKSTGRLHLHEHGHGEHTHVHFHAHDSASAHHAHPVGEPTSGSPVHSHGHAALAIGTLHGLAGSSHFLGVIPALAFPTLLQSVLYITSFGVGTIVSMALFASLLGWTRHRLSSFGARIYPRMLYACGVVSIGVGSYWLVSN